jgi:hypothetical protein
MVRCARAPADSVKDLRIKQYDQYDPDFPDRSFLQYNIHIPVTGVQS